MSSLAFLCPPALDGRIPPPRPAAKFLPEWFRALPRALGMPDAHGLQAHTVRACLPVTDAFALGWIIPLPFDIQTSRDSFGQLRFHWATDLPFAPVEQHHPAQIGAYDAPFHGRMPLKFINPWRIVLPPGWSAAFLHPVNHFELPFTAFNGVVDCDALEVPVNIPFLWTDPGEGVALPAGTPMVQVVPFERRAAITDATVRAETATEAEARAAALARKYGEESVYAREWRHRHDREPPP
ncbi:DUF6065 family protein [Maliponia aquimaris]|uniref:Uncharacterized protein n=1 Tax=Maliponia aquimaris TaxID=1673631 RepID=A0A238KWX4_9RHOB|nr:DUF6065 family protein [Maliponia aquimaris]SMX47315.1 hypothetical protein MAA8898_03627 [Maliponia aquimaris]